MRDAPTRPDAVTGSADGEFSLRSIAVAAFGPSVLFGLAEGAILPVIVLSATRELGASVALASLVAALVGVGAIVANIPAGALTTRVGERRAMLAAAGLTLVGLAACLVASQLWLFALGVLLVGCASAVFNLARQSYLADAVPFHLRARAMSTLGGSMRIGVFVGPFLGAAAIHAVGLRGAYLVAVLGTLAAAALVWRVPDLEAPAVRHPVPDGARPSTVAMFRAHWRTFATLGTGVLLLSAVRGTRQVVVPLWAEHLGLPPTTASIVYGIAGGVDMLVFYPAGLVMDRFGRRAVAVPSMLVMGTAFVLLPLTHSAGTLALVAMLLGFGNGIGSGIVMTLGADVSPPVGRPTFLGVWREFADGGSALGPVLLSAVAGVASLAAAAVVTGGVAYAAAATLARWIPRRRTS